MGAPRQPPLELDETSGLPRDEGRWWTSRDVWEGQRVWVISMGAPLAR